MRVCLLGSLVTLATALGSLTLGCNDQVGIGGENLAGSGGDETGGSGGSVAPSATGGVPVTGGSGGTGGEAMGGVSFGTGGIAGTAGAGTVVAGACEPGLYYFCMGSDACFGQQPCLASGDGYGACECLASGMVPATDYPTDPVDFSLLADPDVPIIIPNETSPTYPGDGCPTRPDLVQETVCGEDVHCRYGMGCWWICQCQDSLWSCGVLLC